MDSKKPNNDSEIKSYSLNENGVFELTPQKPPQPSPPAKQTPTAPQKPIAPQPPQTAWQKTPIAQPNPTVAPKPQTAQPSPTAAPKPQTAQPSPTAAQKPQTAQPNPTVAQKPQTAQPSPTDAQKPQTAQPSPTAAPKPQATQPNPTAAQKPQTAQPSPTAAQKPQATQPSPTVAQKPQTAQPSPTAAPKPQDEPPAKDDRMATRVSSIKPEPTSVTSFTATSLNSHNKKKKKSKKDVGANTVLSLVKAFVYIFSVITVSVFLAVGLIAIGNDVFAFVKPEELIEITIPEGADLAAVSAILGDNDVIEYPTVFKLYGKIKKDNGKFVPGDYTVSSAMDYEDLLYTFKEKATVGTVRIMIPEGYTTDEIIDLFIANKIGVKGVVNSREAYINVINNYNFDYWFVDELEENGWSEDRFYRLDGYLFPDTYEFYLESSPETVINKLLRRFNQIFTQECRDRAAALGMTTDEVITLASLIEKEAKFPQDRKTVSSVFTNRLNNPYTYPLLQSDATIMYAIHHDTGERKKELTGDDVKYETPYNSYKYKGLPPGPIANSSIYSIRCALYPANTNYYYFISDARGNIIPAATLAEHEANIKKYLNGNG